MHPSTLQLGIVKAVLPLVLLLACTKDTPQSTSPNETPSPQEPVPNAASSLERLLGMPLPSASSSIDETIAEKAALECPNTNDWHAFESFDAECAWAWTTDEQKLPAPLEWEPCSPRDGAPKVGCQKLQRQRRLQTFAVGINAAGDTQIGFVENCPPEQIVVANVDGPTRFAMRRRETERFPKTCQMKLLAVEMDHWLAALGGHEMPPKSTTSGYSVGGAFIGGTIGSAPNVLRAHGSSPFHVATTQGSILPEGWMADGKRQSWDGKPLEKPPRLHLERITKRLFVDEKKGIYLKTNEGPELVLEVPKGRTFTGFQHRDKQIIWQERSHEHSWQKCSLFGGEIDARDVLVKPRRIAEMPCTSSKLALGCDMVLASDDTQMRLIALSDGTTRILPMKGDAAAVDCKSAFIERPTALFRIDVAAFGPAKVPLDPSP